MMIPASTLRPTARPTVSSSADKDGLSLYVCSKLSSFKDCQQLSQHAIQTPTEHCWYFENQQNL